MSTYQKTSISTKEVKCSSFKNGNKRIISTSKIKKIKVTKKNWREKVEVFQKLDENPHSKGLFFSKSIPFFMNKEEKANATSLATMVDSRISKKNTSIKVKKVLKISPQQ